MLDERIAPYVPEEALQRPAGAAVDNGMVTCVACQVKLPVANADIVGQGYRCVPCSHKAHVAKLSRTGGDGMDHFSANEQSALRESGKAVIWGGAALIIAGGMLLAGMWFRTGTASLLIGVITVAIGLARRRAAA